MRDTTIQLRPLIFLPMLLELLLPAHYRPIFVLCRGKQNYQKNNPKAKLIILFFYYQMCLFLNTKKTKVESFVSFEFWVIDYQEGMENDGLGQALKQRGFRLGFSPGKGRCLFAERNFSRGTRSCVCVYMFLYICIVWILLV